MNPEEDDSDWKSDTTLRIGNYRGNNLSYGMLCEPINSDNEETEGYKLSSNTFFNPQILATNIGKF